MTRDEAINILWQYDVNFEPHPAEDVMHAIDMAIEALKAQSELFGNSEQLADRTTDDCIRRADVEQTVEDNILCYTHSGRPIDQDPDTECHKAIRTALRMLRKDLRKLPSAQPDHVAEVSKKVEDDVISRQAAIDALDKRFDDVPMELTTEILQLRRDLRERIPSAQPVDKDINVPITDTISRQAAIDALEKLAELYPWRVPGDRDSYSQYNEAWNDALNRAESEIEALASAPDHNADIDKKVGLECLRCKQTYDYSWDTMDEISYTMYSYCPDCIRKGILLLKAQDKEGANDEPDE